MLRFAGFNGANKALHPLALPPGVGRNSVNQRPGRGDLRPWKAASNVATVPASRVQIYRMGRDVPSDAQYWLSWTVDVDVVRSLTADDTTERTFWSGDGAPKWTDNTIGLTTAPYPTVVRTLGVPAPASAPTITIPTTGTGSVQTRYYVWTWVTDKGEESAPSPPSAAVTSPVDSTYRVTFNEAIPTLRGINRKRLYRTVTGASGATDFYFITEVTSATTTFDDVNTTPVEPLPSATWLEPPAALKGLKALWNGIMAGFVGKSVRFSVPYRPFAWPIEYELVFDDTVVALGMWGQNLLVLTTGRPYLVTGSDPESMTSQQLEVNQACVAKRSVVDMGHGVVWASPDGLTYMGQGGSRVLTQDLFRREDWQALVPSTMIASEYEGLYFVSYNPGGGRVGMVLDPMNPQGCYFLSSGWDAAFRDPITDGLYLLNGTNVQKWDASTTALSATYESRIELLAQQLCFSWGRVIADAYPVTLSITVNGTSRLTNKSVTSGAPFRLPAGFTGDQWSISVVTSSPVQAVLIGSNVNSMIGAGV